MAGQNTSAAMTLVQLTRCPVFGGSVTGGGGGVHYAAAMFSCGAYFETANGEVSTVEPCPAPSAIAAEALNRKLGQLQDRSL
jgi:hypothetical protein